MAACATACIAAAASKRVAVVGAGAAGLVTGKFLRDAGITIDIFERAPALGGIWRYNQTENQVLYRGLKTNLPKEIMQYFSMPFDSSLPSFLVADDMLGYLESYASEFGLREHIHFNRTITSVTPLFDEASDAEVNKQPKQWIVKHVDTSESRDNQDSAKEVVGEYDYIVVANGHYDTPNMPTEAEVCAGFDSFPNQVMHSHDYDDPSIFANKSVVLIGAGASGADIAREISQVGSVVVVDRHLPVSSPEMVEVGGELDNVYRCQSIEKITKDGVVHFNAMKKLEDGTLEQFRVYADVILLCTGYNYDFPFIDSGNATPLLTCNNRRVDPLYLQLFHAKYPSLALVGIPYLIVPFPFFEVQARLLAAVFSTHIHGNYSAPLLSNP